ncbi:hypothetical protein BDP27DRAFT_273441 [Rhodocollybia butyracea]|uniref:F-box domain-containing protein n=1 Tax=Rhodocollybia butyracea TaxID=206335 RepID=A0A9P5PBY8_9AGAR|nr:hypothetical protein BDP27DRAFT_273441 [Rhodocollybia butyracea]
MSPPNRVLEIHDTSKIRRLGILQLPTFVLPSCRLYALHTNYAATLSKALLTAPRDKLSQLANEINRQQNTLNGFTSPYNHLKTHVGTHLALISLLVLRHLPRELSSEIFITCLPSDRNRQNRLLLTCISKGMWDVVLAMPQRRRKSEMCLPLSISIRGSLYSKVSILVS